MAAALYPMLLLVNQTPDRIPADIIAEEQDAADSKGVEKRIVGADVKV
jgi:hypothetical protein